MISVSRQSCDYNLPISIGSVDSSGTLATIKYTTTHAKLQNQQTVNKQNKTIN